MCIIKTKAILLLVMLKHLNMKPMETPQLHQRMNVVNHSSSHVGASEGVILTVGKCFKPNDESVFFICQLNGIYLINDVTYMKCQSSTEEPFFLFFFIPTFNINPNCSLLFQWFPVYQRIKWIFKKQKSVNTSWILKGIFSIMP